MSAKEISLKPNEVLFEEGDQSKNLYFVKAGMIRIFKRKAEGKIEIETIRNGQIFGELSFLDGQPRSASAEALTTCQLIEISNTALEEAMSKQPEWLVSLTKTVSSRLRVANNRIRVLEALSTEYETDKYGNRSKEYLYITTSELLRFCTALVAVAARYGKNATSDGIEFNLGTLERFATPILYISASKVISLIEVFKSAEILKGNLFLTDILFVDQFIQYANEQNLMDPAKKQTLTKEGLSALELIVKNRGKGTPIPNAPHFVSLNIGPFLKGSKVQSRDLQVLLDQGFVRNILLNSAEEILIDFDGPRTMFLYRTFTLFGRIDELNEQKRKG